MALAPDIVAGVSRRLVEHAGLELPTWVVEARTLVRIAALAVTPEAYVELIATPRGAGELSELVEAVRVGESSLFRHRSQIAALTDVVVPALRERGRRTVRVWSAGCASGEEPYTLAIVLSRALPGHAVSIIATDVSDDALEVAQRATFPGAELADVPDEYRDAFTTDGDRVRVRPEIVQLVRFERANLLDAVPPRDCDVVWCRNVLIYFSVAARRRAIDRLVAATVPAGFVFVGYSESLREITELDAQRAGDAVFYVKRGDWTAAERTPVPELSARERTSPGLATEAPFAAPRTGTQIGVQPVRTGTNPAVARSAGASPRRTPATGAPAVDARRTPATGVPVVNSHTNAAARSGDAPSRRTPATGVPVVDSRTNAAARSGDAPLRRTPATGVPAIDARTSATSTRSADAAAAEPTARRTPAIGVPVTASAATESVLVLAGAPDAAEVTNLLGERLAIGGLRHLTIDLDTAVMLDDALAPVIRRACAAARSAGVAIVIRATRTGAKRWVSRHGLEEVSA